MLVFTVLGPYQAPHRGSQSREYAAIYGTWGLSASPHMLPKSRLCCYVQYLGPIRLPRWAPKVKNMLLFTVLGPYQPSHMCSQSRDHAVIYGTWALSGSPHRRPKSRICCYLRYLGPITPLGYDPDPETSFSGVGRGLGDAISLITISRDKI